MCCDPPGLAGQDTLLACWRALAASEFGPGQVVRTPLAVVAVFPRSAYFNNAILTASIDRADRAAAAVASIYDAARISSWAFWVPSLATSFAGEPDRFGSIGALRRDETTVVMQLALRPGLRHDHRVKPVSGPALQRLVSDEAVPAEQLGRPTAGRVLTGWALVEKGTAVASAYTYRHAGDCGVYAVGTVPSKRRQGFARSLVEHVLAEAHADGARTATLQSTPMGLHLYEQLGFQPVGRYEEWQGTRCEVAGS